MRNEKARQTTIRRAFLFTEMEYVDRFVIGRNVTASLLRNNAEFFDKHICKLLFLGLV